MTKFFVAVAGALLLATPGARAQVVCVGDCSGDGAVAINELITGVNIALGSAEVSSCPVFDADESGSVSINELIRAVAIALGASCDDEPPTGVCGNGTEDEGEECDDGNNFGGDGCAANCTEETARTGQFDSTRTIAIVQTEGLGPIRIPLVGSQTFRTGKPRDTTTTLATGDPIPAGHIPVVLRASELLFDPVVVPGLVCACVRGSIPAGEVFGPLNFATGAIACGEEGLQDIDYRLVQDHNTTPGHNCNDSQGTPDDAECSLVNTLPGGLTSAACREGGDDDRCDDEENRHIGVCNSPRSLERSGGEAPRGSAFILYNTQIGLLQDGGSCRTDRPQRPGGGCLFPDYGPDCTPCTDDDLQKGDPENLPATTGIAEAAMYDTNNNQTSRCSDSRPVIIEDGRLCGGSPCETKREGALFDCDALLENPTGGIEGGGLAIAYPSIDARTIADNVTSTVFFNRAAQ